MAKRPKHGVLTLTPEVVETRLRRAMAEDRLQQALELAKQLFKLDPSPQHRDLLRQAYLGRAAQQRKQGYFRDAQTTLQNAVNLAQTDPASLESIAEELARCGATGQALRLVATLPESPAQARIAGLATDWAIVDGSAGARQLPAEFQSQLDLVVKAFRQIQNGEDEAAREVLQGIGLQSPFLEWKLFLRGLQAYYQSDDVRA